MRHAYVLYLASADRDRGAREGTAPCCSDVPATARPASSAHATRWARKIARAVPASVSAFRQTLGTPLHLAKVAPGDTVVTRNGRTVGEVRDVYLARGARQPALGVSPAGADRPAEVLLFPVGAVRRRAGVLVLDDDAVGRVA